MTNDNNIKRFEEIAKEYRFWHKSTFHPSEAEYNKSVLNMLEAAYSLDRAAPDGGTAELKWDDSCRFKIVEKHAFYPGSENIYDFGFYDGFQHAAHKVQLATKPLEDKIKALEERQRWIPVSERLPEEGDEYNVVLDLQDGLGDPVSSTLEFDAIKKEWFYPGTDIYSDKVTHWQPLPTPHGEWRER